MVYKDLANGFIAAAVIGVSLYGYVNFNKYAHDLTMERLDETGGDVKSVRKILKDEMPSLCYFMATIGRESAIKQHKNGIRP